MVPWLHTVAVTWIGPPGKALGAPALTAVTTRSGPEPTPILPPAVTLLSSRSSGTTPMPSVMAPAKYVPGLGGTEKLPLSVAHAPAARKGGGGSGPARKSPAVMVVSVE